METEKTELWGGCLVLQGRVGRGKGGSVLGWVRSPGQRQMKCPTEPGTLGRPSLAEDRQVTRPRAGGQWARGAGGGRGPGGVRAASPSAKPTAQPLWACPGCRPGHGDSRQGLAPPAQERPCALVRPHPSSPTGRSHGHAVPSRRSPVAGGLALT